MSCEFVGWCALLSPDWISALATLVGTAALLVGAIAAERIRRTQVRREEFEKGEHLRLLTYNTLYRVRSLQDEADLNVSTIRQFLQVRDPPAGIFISFLDHLISRIDEFEFNDAERAAMGPERSLVLSEAVRNARQAKLVSSEAIALLRDHARLDPLDANGIRRVEIAVEQMEELARRLAGIYLRLGEPHISAS